MLNSASKAYLEDTFEYISLPFTVTDTREIYEFETKADFRRRIRYVLEGNRVSIFIISGYGDSSTEQALKLFNTVKYFSIKEVVEKRMAAVPQKSLPQSPALKFTQTDAALDNLKGRVKWVRTEALDVPLLVGNGERRIAADETYDRAGNLLKSFWFQNGGYPTSVTVFGFVGGARVSASEDLDYDTTFTITSTETSNVKLPTPDPRFEERYQYRYDTSKRLIERKEFNNLGILQAVYKFTYKDDWMDEKWFDDEGKLNSTKRRRFDKNGNVIKYEFWWYEQTDKEEETYEYKKFDSSGNWTERQVVRKITDEGLIRTRTYNEFRTITYYP